MEFINTLKRNRRVTIVIIIIVILCSLLIGSQLMSIFEEGIYGRLRPTDGSVVRGLTQEILVDIRIENHHPIIENGIKNPTVNVAGLNATYNWNKTIVVTKSSTIQRVFLFEEHSFPSYGHYQLSVSVFYYEDGNTSKIVNLEKKSVFEIKEPLAEQDTTAEEITYATTQITDGKDNTLIFILTRGLGVVLLLGIGVIAVIYLRKTGKIKF